MKKVLVILVISFNVLLSQTDSLNEALRYYPLHIGDFWQYEIEKGHLASNNSDSIGIASFEIVGDTILENGKKYFHRIPEGTESHIMSILLTPFIRIDSSTGMVYGNNGTGDEFIIDSLLASINDTVDYFTVIDINNKNIFGIEAETKTYTTSVLSSYDFYKWDISKDLGLTWYYYGDGNQMEKYEYNLVFAKINGNEFGTFVNIERTTELNLQYRLSQNYPNPFNPSTTIKYQIPMLETLHATSQLQNVQLSVYDVLGREVTTLVNQKQSPGNYTITFDAKNLPSGLYLYKLTAGSFSQTKKMLLMK